MFSRVCFCTWVVIVIMVDEGDGVRCLMPRCSHARYSTHATQALHTVCRRTTTPQRQPTLRRRCGWPMWPAHGAYTHPHPPIHTESLHRARERLYLTYIRQGPGGGRRSPLLDGLEDPQRPTARDVVVHREEPVPPRRGHVAAQGGAAAQQPAPGSSRGLVVGGRQSSGDRQHPPPTDQPPKAAGFVSARSLMP